MVYLSVSSRVASSSDGACLSTGRHAHHHALVEAEVEPAATPHELVDGGAVEPVDRSGEAARIGAELVAAHGADRDPLLRGRGVLALELVALLAREAGEEVVEGAV